MSLPRPPKEYDQSEQAGVRGLLDQMDKKNYKRDQDLEIGSDRSFVMTDTVTGLRGTISVASGVITWAPL